MAEQEHTPQPKKPLARRILKWGAITLATLVVLIIIAVAIIPHLVNLGPVKREIEHVASRGTGRTVTVAGPLSLSLFPWVGFGAHDVTMANAAGFSDKPFLHAKELEIHVRLIPLIFRHVQVSGVTLDHPTLNLARRTDGRSNWQDLTGGGTNAGKSVQHQMRSSALANLSVGRITINGATVDYADAQTGHDYTFDDVDLTASDIAPDRVFPLHLQLKFNSRQPHVNGSLSLDASSHFDASASKFGLDNGTLAMTVSGGGLARPLTLDARWSRLAVDQNAGTASLNGLQASVAGVTAKLDASARGLQTAPALGGRLQIAPFSPRKVLATLGQPVPAQFRGFDTASLNAAFRADSKALMLSNLTLHLDATTMTGRLGMPFGDGDPMTFDLAADRIDVDRYLPAGAGTATHAAGAHGQKFLETRLPGRLLKNLDLDGHVTVGELDALGLKATDVALTLKAAGGKTALRPLQARVYGGRYSGTIDVATVGEGVGLDATQKLANVDAGKIITALGGGSRLSGTADAAVALKGSGDTIAELLDTLEGQATFVLRNGALEGINLWDQLERAYALVKDHKRLPAGGPQRTEFANVQGSAKIAHGVLTNDALEAILPFLVVTGHGSVDLNKHYVNYDLLAKVTKTPKTAGADLASLEGVTVPVHVSGDFSDLRSVPDMKAALQARAKAALDKKLQEQKQNAEKKIRSKLQELLENSGGGGGG